MAIPTPVEIMEHWLDDQHRPACFPNPPPVPTFRRVINFVDDMWTCDTLDRNGATFHRYWAQDREDARQFCERGY